jgi:PAS domain S-box-containing protein
LFSFAFLGLILVMSASLTTEVVQASVLSREVAANERRWRSLLEDVRLFVVGVDEKGRINYVNPYFVEVSGFSADDIVGQLFYDLAPTRDREHLLSLLQDSMTGTVKPYLQTTLLTKDGTERQIVWSNVLLRDPDGVISGVLSIGADVTERLEAEAARDKAIRELETLKGRLEEENIYLREEIQSSHGFTEIVGEGDALLYVLSRVKQVAGTDATVLIQGETGVGKELISWATHQSSGRSEKPFIKVNCAALPTNLVESELFGHEKGAFTGAHRLHKGRFELADGGTLFLDEVSELPPEAQAKLLRALQDGEFERVGGSQTLRSDVRVIAATNRNLDDEVAAGRFRADLFYRLNVYPITVPPLRNRKEDIPLLVNHFVPQIGSRIGKKIDQVPPHVMEQLVAYEWPGNVRELKNVLERAVITSRGSVLLLPDVIGGAMVRKTEIVPETGFRTLEAMDRQHILSVLHETDGRISGPNGAAKILGLKPSTLRSRMKKLGIRKSV